jgi:hypothetical protein
VGDEEVAGDVQQDVDATLAACHGGEGPDIVFVGDAACDGDEVVPGAGAGAEVVQGVGGEVGGDDAVAVGEEALDECGADSTGGAGDDDDAAGLVGGAGLGGLGGGHGIFLRSVSGQDTATASARAG